MKRGSFKLGRLKIEVRRVTDGVLLQVDDQWHVVLTDDAALELAALLYSAAEWPPPTDGSRA